MGLDYEIGCLNCKRFVNLGKFRYSENMYFIGERKLKRFLGMHSNSINSKCKLFFGGGDDEPWFDKIGPASDWQKDILSLWKTNDWEIYDSSKFEIDTKKLGDLEIGCLKCNSYVIINNKKHPDGFSFDYESLHFFFSIHKSHKEIIVHFSSEEPNQIPWKNIKTSNKWQIFHLYNEW
jgi:hypothetical protein